MHNEAIAAQIVSPGRVSLRVIAFHNLKGGVGKTAAAVNIAYLAARHGIPTLLWDLDAQGAASWYLGESPDVVGEKAARLVKGKTPVGQMIRQTDYELLDLIPAHPSFRNLDVRLETEGHKHALRDWLKPLSEDYGLVVLDCPPSLSKLAEQILQTADQVYVPIIPSWLSLNSWEQLLAFAREKKLEPGKFHPFLSMVDRRKKIHQDILQTRKGPLKQRMKAFIPYASDVEKMGERRCPVELIRARAPAALSYQLLWKEIRKITRL